MIDSKVVVDVNEEDNISYPKLIECGDLIVLVTTPCRQKIGSGIVIVSDIYSVGEIRNDFILSRFKDFTGEVKMSNI